MLSLTLLILALGGLLVSKRLLGDYFSPPAIYTFFWAFSLGMLELDLVAYDTLRPRVWAVIGTSYAAFMLGCGVVLAYGLCRPGWLNARPRLDHIDRTRLERVLLALFVLGVAGFAVQVFHLQSAIGLETFVTDPRAAREGHSNVKYLGFFNILNVFNFVLGAAYLALYKKPRAWVLLIVAWAVLTTFLTTDRTRFFYMVIWGFYVLVYLQRRVRLGPRIIAAAVVTATVLMVFFLLIARVYKKEAFDDNMEFVNVSSTYAPMIDPYIYLTGSFPVLQAFLEDSHEHTGGKLTFSPIVKLIEVVYPELERESFVGKFYRVPIELNACTYLEPFYKDFGFLGTALVPLALGVICMWSYLVMRQRKTLFTVIFVALLSFCVTISIFVSHFTQIATWYFIGVAYLVHRYCRTTEPRPDGDFRQGIFA